MEDLGLPVNRDRSVRQLTFDVPDAGTENLGYGPTTNSHQQDIPHLRTKGFGRAKCYSIQPPRMFTRKRSKFTTRSRAGASLRILNSSRGLLWTPVTCGDLYVLYSRLGNHSPISNLNECDKLDHRIVISSNY